MKREPPEMDFVQRNVAGIVLMAMTFVLFVLSIFVGSAIGLNWLPGGVAFAGMAVVAAVTNWHNRSP